MSDGEIFGQLLHGAARAWRQKLDERLKPMGLSQAKWRTLMHLSLAEDALTQAEIAARLGVEEPTVVTLLHRLEKESWITRKNSPSDRRCKLVLLAHRAQRVITQIKRAADDLRHELRRNGTLLVYAGHDGHMTHRRSISTKRALGTHGRKRK